MAGISLSFIRRDKKQPGTPVSAQALAAPRFLRSFSSSTGSAWPGLQLISKTLSVWWLALALLGCGSESTTPEAPECHVAPSLLNFGLVEGGHAAERSFKIWNEGSGPLQVTVGLECPEYEIIEGGGDLTIAPRESAWVRIEYRPTTRQDSQCTVDLVGADCTIVGCIGNPFRRWYIRADGSGDAPTIQAAIDSSKDGDEIVVGSGTYYENIDFMGHDIVLRSELGPKVTILDGSRRDSSVVVIRRGESRAAVLEGFTITGGRGSRLGEAAPQGGGVRCLDSSPTIRGNWVIGNQCEPGGAGGGISAATALHTPHLVSPLIQGNTVEANSSGQNGGGLALFDGSHVVEGNVFRGNRCTADGAGVWVWVHRGAVSIQDNEFWENEAGDHGGGAYVAQYAEAGECAIEGNLFARNRTTGTGHIGDTGSGGAIAALEVTGVIRQNTLVANDGSHLTSGGGGGLLLYRTGSGLKVCDNLIAFNEECGIACWDGTATMGPNLLWANTGGDLGGGLGECPETWADVLLFTDPFFCDFENDDFRVAENSPALTGKEVMGAYSEPGCGPETPAPATTRTSLWNPPPN